MTLGFKEHPLKQNETDETNLDQKQIRIQANKLHLYSSKEKLKLTFPLIIPIVVAFIIN